MRKFFLNNDIFFENHEKQNYEFWVIQTKYNKYYGKLFPIIKNNIHGGNNFYNKKYIKQLNNLLNKLNEQYKTVKKFFKN